VDGQSDIDALRNAFDALFDEIGGDNVDVQFRYAEFQGENHGDITSLSGVNDDNIEKMIYKYYFKNQDAKIAGRPGWNEITHIIHIIDLDGAYIPDTCVSPFTEAESEFAKSLSTSAKPKNTLYYDDHIAVADPEGKARSTKWMQERNYRKRKNIEHLLTIDELSVGKRSINYSLYYFSSNLDHFLFNDANLAYYEKIKMATYFSDHYSLPESFADFIFSDKSSTTYDNYYSSWKAIKKGLVSLQRGTNINLLVTRLYTR
jgi:hypothetical protein